MAEFPKAGRTQSVSSDGETDESSGSSSSLNALDRNLNHDDVQSIALLRQIFPEEKTERLRQIHRARLSEASSRNHVPHLDSRLECGHSQSDGSQLVQSIQRRAPHNLPHDFLRLPPEVAVRRYCKSTGKWRYVLLEDLANRVYRNTNSERIFYYSKAIFRDARIGLGMTLAQLGESLVVHAVNDRNGKHWLASPTRSSSSSPGPSIKAGILPGDALVGINGKHLEEYQLTGKSSLQSTVLAIMDSPEPVVIHFGRMRHQDVEIPGTPSVPPIPLLAFRVNTPSLLDASDVCDESSQSMSFLGADQRICSTPLSIDLLLPEIHPFVKVLYENQFIKSVAGQLKATSCLSQMDNRTREWEETMSISSIDERSGRDTFVSLVGVRKALSVRIVNSFLDGRNRAYTIWVYDVESGKEWYAPVRYWADFRDLREATVKIFPATSKYPFPKQGLGSFFGSPLRGENSNGSNRECHELEKFLRALCTIFYCEEIHEAMGQVAVHLQSFLGCDAVLHVDSHVAIEVNMTSLLSMGYSDTDIVLKKSLQIYTFRLFLLADLSAAVDSFVTLIRSRKPSLSALEEFESQGLSTLKARALENLTQIRAFLDLLQDLILEGCAHEFRSIASYFNQGFKDSEMEVDSRFGRLIREAVREQVEIEVYIPLRSFSSRWLVHGWRHDDMEIQFKIKELKKRPQSFFRMSGVNRGALHWSSAIAILREGVSRSTLPCAKLRAIVQAAREISQLYKEDQNLREATITQIDTPPLGADEFLPIFIFCVVQAEMERPCALCALLRCFCDRVNRTGEIGYYLASFEAAIAHFEETDLTKGGDEMDDFLSIPLDDN